MVWARPSRASRTACAAASAGVGDERAGELAGAERAVGLVGAVGEAFASGLQSHAAPDVQHRRCGESEERDVRVPACDAFADGARNPSIVHGDVVDRAVRLDMDDAAMETLHDGVETDDLIEDGLGDFGGGHRHLDAAEVGAVGIPGVRADADAASEREACGALHGGVVARVRAARNVGGGDVLHQGGFVRRVVELAHVAV